MFSLLEQGAKTTTIEIYSKFEMVGGLCRAARDVCTIEDYCFHIHGRPVERDRDGNG
jgi:hypothetical protein